MKAWPAVLLALLLALALTLGPLAQSPAAAQYQVTGGVNILSVPPRRVCVGDTFTLKAAASTDYPPIHTSSGASPLAPLKVTTVQANAELGRVTPELTSQYNDGFYLDLTYRAVEPGTETITLVLNNGLATYQERFQVEEQCDFDAFLMEVIHLSFDTGDEQFRSLTHVTGTGTMKRDREGSQFYQGDGTWHLEETVLSKPSICVEYYIPPLITSGPFELDGRLSDEGEEVDVILSFLPRQGEPVYYGKSICVDENGETGYGWGYLQGGDPTLAAKIEASFPAGGGSQAVEMEGKGLEMVRSMGNFDYTARLTLIPR